MKFKKTLLLFLFSSFSLFPSHLQAAEGKKAMVATADSHSTRAALEILYQGGNAVDAAIAAQWVLNVTEPQGSGIGGGGFFLYYDAATKHVYSFDGREAAPGDAYPEMFMDPKTGHPYEFYPDRITGGLSVGVPGALKLLKTVHERFGSKKFKFGDLFNPAIALAKKGFPVSPRLAAHIAQESERFKLFPASSKIFLDAKGNPIPEGAILFQRDLAKTFSLIQKEGIETFYSGAIARDIVRAVRLSPFHPGLMNFQDLEGYKVFEREPLRASYRGYDVFSMAPPSSGGSTLIEALQILETFPLRDVGRNVQGLHLLADAQSIAFEDRNKYLGDPAYSKIPLDKLLSKTYAKKRAQEINSAFSRDSVAAKLRRTDLEGTHTTHISIVDEYGNMVAFTTTIESVFGSAMVVPGRGFVLNNELTDFDASPLQSGPGPDIHSLSTVGGQAPAAAESKSRRPSTVDRGLLPNAPEGDKRPRSSMTPTFIFRNGEPVMILGSPGGSTIIGTVLNIIVNVLDFEMSLKAALQAPKLIHRGEYVEVETGLMNEQKTIEGLRKLQHTIKLKETFGNAQVILFDRSSKKIYGESDLRGEGEARGY